MPKRRNDKTQNAKRPLTKSTLAAFYDDDAKSRMIPQKMGWLLAKLVLACTLVVLSVAFLSGKACPSFNAHENMIAFIVSMGLACVIDFACSNHCGYSKNATQAFLSIVVYLGLPTLLMMYATNFPPAKIALYASLIAIPLAFVELVCLAVDAYLFRHAHKKDATPALLAELDERLDGVIEPIPEELLMVETVVHTNRAFERFDHDKAIEREIERDWESHSPAIRQAVRGIRNNYKAACEYNEQIDEILAGTRKSFGRRYAATMRANAEAAKKLPAISTKSVSRCVLLDENGDVRRSDEREYDIFDIVGIYEPMRKKHAAVRGMTAGSLLAWQDFEMARLDGCLSRVNTSGVYVMFIYPQGCERLGIDNYERFVAGQADKLADDIHAIISDGMPENPIARAIDMKRPVAMYVAVCSPEDRNMMESCLVDYLLDHDPRR